MHDVTSSSPWAALLRSTESRTCPKAGSAITSAPPRPAPWAAAEFDPERALAQLNRRFPHASIWLGEFTGRYWALVCDRFGRDHLLEATSLSELSGRVAALPPRPHAHAKSRDRHFLHTSAPRRQPSGKRTSTPSPSRTPAGRHAGKRASLFRRVLDSLVCRDTATSGRARGHK
jgi:hypothetical protein